MSEAPPGKATVGGWLRPQGPLRRLLRWSRWLILALLLPTLLVAGYAQWWWLPRLNEQRPALAAALSAALHVPAQIEAVAAVRDGWRLQVRLQGVSLHDPADQSVLARFGQATASLDLWRSLWQWQPVFSAIRLDSISLALEQGPDGLPRLRAGLGGADAPLGATLPTALRWLLAAGRLDLAGERLELRWHTGQTLSILHPYVQVREIPAGWRLAFSAELPAAQGGQVHGRLDWMRAADQSDTGIFTARADLNLAGWPGPLEWAAGQLTLDLRGAWRDWRPVQVESQVRLTQAALAPPQRLAALQRWLTAYPTSEMALAGEWAETAGWRWRGALSVRDNRDRVLGQPHFAWSQENGAGQIQAWNLRVQDLTAWGSPWLDQAAQRWLTALDPQGTLPELTAQIDPAAGVTTVTAAFEDLAWRPTQGLPGCRTLTGTLAWRADGSGQIALQGRRARVDAAGLLRAPITLERLAGTVSWRETAKGLALESPGLELANSDLNARIWGRVTLPPTGAALLDVQGRYRDVQVSAARRYLPTLIPAKGLAWLEQALVGGRVSDGEWLLRGPMAAFPFDGGEGLFETRFQVQDGILDYAPGWPRLEALKAEVTFRNRGLRIKAETGRLRGFPEARLEGVTTQIDDLDDVVVQVNGQVQGPTASLWRALRESPLQPPSGGQWPDLGFQGASTLELHLEIPTDERPTRARGQAHLADNRLALPEWRLEFAQLRGAVRFTEAGLAASRLQGRWRDAPVTIDLDVIGQAAQRILRARLQGHAGLATLAGTAQAKALASYLTGQSRWEAELRAPLAGLGRNSEGMAPPHLTLRSDLRGMAVSLPPPLGKAAAQARPLTIQVQPRPSDRLEATLEYGDVTRAALEIGETTRAPRLLRGELRINAGPARLPSQPGLQVIAELPQWEWSAADGMVTDSSEISQFVQRLDARIGRWILGGYALHDVALSASRQAESWQVDFSGKDLVGRVTAPDRPERHQPINAALERLALHALPDPPSTAPVGLDPRRLPPLVLTAADLRWDERELGRLRLVAMPRAWGLALEELNLESAGWRVDATGDWRWDAAGAKSHVHALLRSPALGETLAALGYAETGVKGGATEAELMADWAGGWPELTLERLTGELHLKIGPGQLLDVEPGMGRVMGLFNVQALLRRFTLDFSDLLAPGMGFDQIRGDVLFGQGRAYTQNLTLEAPAAQIRAEGEVDLRQRTYDQRITVSPKLNGALPVAGAIAGGPVAGAAAFVAERLLQKGIQSLTGREYWLRGSWEAPILERWHQETAAGSQKAVSK